MIPLESNIIPLPMHQVMQKLEGVYGAGRRWSDYEVYTLAEICRHPTCVEECELICKFNKSLPAGSKMFPFSAMKCLEKWTELLDRARLHFSAKVHGPERDPARIELRKLTAEMQLLRARFFNEETKVWDSLASEELVRFNVLRKRKKGLEKI